MAYEIVAIASPAGSIGTLRRLFSEMPPALPIPLVCLQSFVTGVGVEDIIARASSQGARYACDGEAIAAGCTLFAPPGCGLVVRAGRLLAVSPAAPGGATVDRFFESVALEYGSTALALLLTGDESDGFEGGRAVKSAGGTLLVEARDGMAYSDATQVLTRTHIADETLDPHALASALSRWIFNPPAGT